MGGQLGAHKRNFSQRAQSPFKRWRYLVLRTQHLYSDSEFCSISPIWRPSSTTTSETFEEWCFFPEYYAKRGAAVNDASSFIATGGSGSALKDFIEKPNFTQDIFT